MAIYAHYQASALIMSGGFLTVAPGAHVEVKEEEAGQPLAALKADRTGASGKANPFDADANGYFDFYAAGGAYQIRIYTDADPVGTTHRYVPIGLNSEADSIASLTEREVTAAGEVIVTNDDADIILIKKTVGEATTVVLPDPATATKEVRIVDRKYDAATNNITIISDDDTSPSTVTIMGGSSYVIDSNGGSIKLKPLADGTGWV